MQRKGESLRHSQLHALKHQQTRNRAAHLVSQPPFWRRSAHTEKEFFDKTTEVEGRTAQLPCGHILYKECRFSQVQIFYLARPDTKSGAGLDDSEQ